MSVTKRYWNGGTHKYVIANVYITPRFAHTCDRRDDEATNELMRALKNKYKMANFTVNRLGKLKYDEHVPFNVVVNLV